MSAIGSVIVMACWPSSPRFPLRDLRRGRWAPVAPSSVGGARGARAQVLVWCPFWLPAGFGDARQFAAVGQVPEADPAQPEPPVHRARPPAARAPGVGAHRELGLPLRLGDQRLLRHWVSSP